MLLQTPLLQIYPYIAIKISFLKQVKLIFGPCLKLSIAHYYLITEETLSGHRLIYLNEILCRNQFNFYLNEILCGILGIGEGNGSPLQCSCQENPRDGGAWWAAVCGVAQGQTRLKLLGSSSSSREDWGRKLQTHENRLEMMHWGSGPGWWPRKMCSLGR